jgi:hypothetical protein
LFTYKRIYVIAGLYDIVIIVNLLVELEVEGDELGRACSTHVSAEKCILVFGTEAWRKRTAVESWI